MQVNTPMHRIRRMAYQRFCDILRDSPTMQASNRSVSQGV